MEYSVVLEAVEKKLKGRYVLQDINLHFEEGKIYGIHGANGSGKTMLLRMIAGLIRPTSGHVIIQGKELHKEMDFPPSIGVLIETPNFWKNYTGIQVLETLGSIKKVISFAEMQAALQRVGLDPKDKRVIRKYSLGMRQKLGIAQAIMEKPDILLLDEPANALDQETVEKLNTIIREESERGATVILASHSINELSKCSALIEMENGRIKKAGI